MAIASAAYAALDREPGGVDYSGLLDETGHAGGDPHRAARAASDRHDDLVRKLEAERTQRDDIEARRARIADTLAFDTPGSRLDVFARARRGTIEAQLRRFGFAGADVELELSQSGARHVDARGRRARRGRDPLDLGLRQPGAPHPVGDRRLRAGLPHPAAAQRRGRRRGRGRQRLAQAGRGLDRRARRLVRPGVGDPVSPRRAGDRAQPVARASVLQHSPARLAAAHCPRSANGARTSTRDRPGSTSASPR